MEELINTMLATLKLAGLHAVAALPGSTLPLLQSPLVAVDVAKADCSQAGIYQYLGVLKEQELYGRRLQATLQLDVYVPEAAGGKGARAAMTDVMNLLMQGGGEMNIGEMSVGGCQYDADCDCFVGKILVPVSVYGYATLSDDGTEFVDFKLEGELK